MLTEQKPTVRTISHDDRGNVVAISDKNRDNINIKNESKSYTIKAMLWNRNLKPLCNVESKTVER